MPPPVPVQAKLPVELTVKARAPQPPTQRPPVPARSPLRRSPSDPGTLPRQVQPQTVQQTPLTDTFTTTFVPKKQKYFSYKKSRPCETNKPVTTNHTIEDTLTESKKTESVDFHEMSKNVLSNTPNSSSDHSQNPKPILDKRLTDETSNSSLAQSSRTFVNENPIKSSVDLLSEVKKTSVSSLPNNTMRKSFVPKTLSSNVQPAMIRPLPTDVKTVCSLSSVQTFSPDVPSVKQNTIQPMKSGFQGKEPTQSNVKIGTPLVNTKIVQVTRPSLKVAAVIEPKLSPSYEINLNSSMTENSLPLQTHLTMSDVKCAETSSLPYFQSSSVLNNSSPKPTPVYSPVYSKQQSRLKSCTGSELKVNPLLSPSLCKKPYLGTDIIKAQKSVKKPVFVLDGWPLGTESLV